LISVMTLLFIILQYAVNVNTTICGDVYFVGGGFMYKRIRDLREDKDMTQKQMAATLNCSQQVYSNYELGQRDVPTHILIALAKIHKTSVDYILGLTNNPKQNKDIK